MNKKECDNWTMDTKSTPISMKDKYQNENEEKNIFNKSSHCTGHECTVNNTSEDVDDWYTGVDDDSDDGYTYVDDPATESTQKQLVKYDLHDCFSIQSRKNHNNLIIMQNQKLNRLTGAKTNVTPSRNVTRRFHFIYVWMTVQDKDEIYVYPASNNSKKYAYRIQHSSLSGGKPVLCAGEIFIFRHGEVRVNNRSGHYKPSKHQLMNFVIFLNRALGVKVSEATDFSSSSPTIYEIRYSGLEKKCAIIHG